MFICFLLAPFLFSIPRCELVKEIESPVTQRDSWKCDEHKLTYAESKRVLTLFLKNYVLCNT